VSKATPLSKEPSLRSTPASADKGFYVQVGTFSSQANAKQLADRLKQHDFPVRLEQVRLASGNALRVRVGPYRQNEQAQAARTAIQRKLGVQGIVRAY
jgi:cell division septation protein DedD